MESDSEPRSLPVIRIHDTEFLVDIRNLEFVQFDDHANKISFRDVRDFGLYTEVTYDPLTKNAFKGSLEERLMRKDLIEVKLPSAIDLDTQGLADEIVINIRKQRALGEKNKETKTNVKPDDTKKKRAKRMK